MIDVCRCNNSIYNRNELKYSAKFFKMPVSGQPFHLQPFHIRSAALEMLCNILPICCGTWHQKIKFKCLEIKYVIILNFYFLVDLDLNLNSNLTSCIVFKMQIKQLGDMNAYHQFGGETLLLCMSLLDLIYI